MSNLFDNLSDKIQHLSNRVAKDGKKYIKSAVSKGEEIGYKGKIKIEIEKLKKIDNQLISIKNLYENDVIDETTYEDSKQKLLNKKSLILALAIPSPYGLCALDISVYISSSVRS